VCTRHAEVIPLFLQRIVSVQVVQVDLMQSMRKR